MRQRLAQMTSAVIHARADTGGRPSADEPAAEPAAAGIHVLGAVQRVNLVQETIRLGPDVLVWHEPFPDDTLFQALQALQTHSPRPALLFTDSADGALIERAVAVGVHACVVGGFAAGRLRSLVMLVRAGFGREREVRGA